MKSKSNYPGVRSYQTTYKGQPDIAYSVRYMDHVAQQYREKTVGYKSQGYDEYRASLVRAELINEGKIAAGRMDPDAPINENQPPCTQLDLLNLWEAFSYTEAERKDCLRCEMANYENEKSLFFNHIAPWLVGKVLQNITRRHLGSDYSVFLVKRKLGSSRRRQCQLLINMFLRSDIVGNENNLRIKKLPPMRDNGDAPPENLTTAERKRLDQVLDNWTYNPPMARMVRLALFTGMRRGELISARFENLSKAEIDGRVWDVLYLPITKNTQSHVVRLSPEAMEVIEEQRKSIRGKEGYIFPGRNGNKRSESSTTKAARAIVKKAGLKNFRPLHGCRASFAGYLADKGVSLYKIQKSLNHSTPQMTQRYAGLSDKGMTEAAEVAGGFFR